jgi:hypothetical protein
MLHKMSGNHRPDLKTVSKHKDKDTGRMVYPHDGGAPYRRAYDPSLIFIDDQEYSFEELRAAKNPYLDSGMDDTDLTILRNQGLLIQKQRLFETEQATSQNKRGILQPSQQPAPRVRKESEFSDTAQDLVTGSGAKRKRGDKENAVNPPVAPPATNGVSKRSRLMDTASPPDQVYQNTATPVAATRSKRGRVASPATATSPTTTINTKNVLAKIVPMFAENVTDSLPKV